MGAITLRPVLVYCWRGYTLLPPWHAMFLFSPCITDVWTNEDIFMWHPVCCCNVIIFLGILCCKLISKTYYLVTEKMQKHIKLSHDDHKTWVPKKKKHITRSQNTCVVTWTEPPIPIWLNIKVTKGPTARVEFENSSLPFLYCQSPFYKNVLYLPFKQLITISITYHLKSQHKTTPHVH